MRRLSMILVLGLILLSLNGPVLASGGSSTSVPEEPAEPQLTPEQEAAEHYNRGISLRNKAWKIEAKLVEFSDDPKQVEKLTKKLGKTYAAAEREFKSATTKNSAFFEAFSDLGYTLRKQGDYDTALEAYDRALALEPNYTAAIEYRAEAYLGLGRIGEAKDAYDVLTRKNSEHAAELLEAMRTWVDHRRADPAGLSAQAIDDFAEWVEQKGAGSTVGHMIPKKKTDW